MKEETKIILIAIFIFAIGISFAISMAMSVLDSQKQREAFCEDNGMRYSLQSGAAHCVKVSGDKIIESFKIVVVDGENYLK